MGIESFDAILVEEAIALLPAIEAGHDDLLAALEKARRGLRSIESAVIGYLPEGDHGTFAGTLRLCCREIELLDEELDAAIANAEKELS